MKNKGLGAALLGGVALDATSMLLSQPEPWLGFPKEDGLPFAGDAAGLKFGGCLEREGGDVARALMTQKETSQTSPTETGMLRMTEAERKAAAAAYDSKAMYQGGTLAGCPAD
jgi:hypothetical protein